jgi:tRNA (guanine-N7-)-methyltransferase
MGRRALRKINASLDLTRHLKTLEDLPRPWSVAAMFGREGPLEVEVGTGKGLFLRNAALATADRNFLGLEVVAKYAAFAAAGMAKQDLQNAVVVQGDALRVFQEVLPDSSVEAVHVYFPDPWWKKRHRKRRVMRESFLHDVERTLVPGGALHFWTDVEEYFKTSLDLIAACTALLGPLSPGEIPAEHDMDYRTHFERRVRQTNEPVFRAEYRKR